MSVTDIVPAPANGMARTGLDQEQVALLKRTICTDATDDEFAMFLGICKRTGLDPFAKQIYFRKYSTNSGPRVTIITGIDGYRLMAQRTGDYAGQSGPEWCGDDGKWVEVWLSNKPPAAARVGVWRAGFKEPAKAIARWTEYYPSNPRERFMWDKMPANQLAKCAEALALRKAFPHELSGVYTKEEMSQASPEPEYIDPDYRATVQDSPGAAPATPPPPKTAAPPPAEAKKKANQIPHDGDLASHAQVALLHALKSKAEIPECDGSCAREVTETRKWGKQKPKTLRCTYHTQLAAFRDQKGNPITTSKDLSKAQISNLIERYETKLAKQENKAQQLPDLGALDREDPQTEIDLHDKLNQVFPDADDETTWLQSVFKQASRHGLTREQKITALGLVMAYVTGEEAYAAALEKARMLGHVA